MSCLSSGFESILEGLFGPELVEDLKLFKGKKFHRPVKKSRFPTIIVANSGILWFECNLLSGHYDNAASLYHLVPLYIHSSLQDSPSGYRREDALCSYQVGVLDGVGPV